MSRFFFAAAAILLLLRGSHSLDAQTPKETPLPHSPLASIEVGDGWLDVLFPPIPLSELGCPAAADSILLVWTTLHNFEDAQPPHGHNVTIDALLRLPGAMPLTEARLDSALPRARFQIREVPRDMNTRKLSNAWLRREGSRIHLRVEDDSAVAAYMRPTDAWGAVEWCQRDRPHGAQRDSPHGIAVPIDRH